MKYDFDEVINRKGTMCNKWDQPLRKYGDETIIPMSIADMDFMCLPQIQQAIMERARHNIYGYSLYPRYDFSQIVAERYQKKGYHVKAEDVIFGTGVVYSMNHIINTFTAEGDRIILPTPYYTHFSTVISGNNREILACPMDLENGRYVLNLHKIEHLVDEKTTMLILCNPHNPTGRILDDDELNDVARFCEKHHLLVIADEIHSDIYLRKPFKPFMEINEYTRNNTFTLSSCAKTFNLAGLCFSFGFICDPEKHRRYTAMSRYVGLHSINVFAVEAMKAAYTYGRQWEQQLREYIRENSDFAISYIRENIPSIKVYENDATYLLWFDCRECGKDLSTLNEDIIKEAHVQLNSGTSYGGADYIGYERMNVACPRSVLKEALDRLNVFFNK